VSRSMSVDLFSYAVLTVDAAVLMLKKKIHRIPIVNEANQVIGK
jgi:CBS domain-containing protein